MTKNIDSEVHIRILEMMIARLRIANYGNLILVFAVTGFLWNSISKEFLIGWVAVNLLITTARVQLVYKRYQNSQIDADNVRAWLIMFCISLGVTNLVWAFAFPQFIHPGSPSLVVLVMFCFFTIIASGTATLSVYMPAFFCHGIPLVSGLMGFFFIKNEPNYWAYGLAVFLFYVVAAMLARSSNRDMQALIRLQIEKQRMAAESEKLKQKAEQASLDKDRFLAAASHDLRQPLHSAGLLLSSLSRYVNEPPATEILADTSSAIKALNHSFSSLLDMSKLDAGVVEPKSQHFYVHDLLQKLAKEYSIGARQKGVELWVEDSTSIINSDKALTERIVRNLLSNALRYTEVGSVRVSAQTANAKVVITVSDTGSGIAPDQQTAVFSEYYQINNPERDRNAGFGLGLSIVKRLVRLLAAELKLESVLGKGSVFKVSLPSGSAENVSSTQMGVINDARFDGLKVLIIDDDEGVRNAIKTVIEGWNCKVLLAESATESIALIDQHEFLPELILADYRLRDNLTGDDAIEQIRDELNSQIPAIIVTGDTSASRLKQALESGFQLLHKPVSAAVLRSAMQKTIFTAS